VGLESQLRLERRLRLYLSLKTFTLLHFNIVKV